MSSPVQAHTEQRRKLIKAAAGASAVFTLPSGAALANVSATCDQKSLKLYQDAAKPTGFSGAMDGWMRVKLQKYNVRAKLPGETNNTTGPGFNYNNRWFRVINSTTGGNKAVEVFSPANTTIVSNEFFYGLVHYDSNAKLSNLVLDQGAETVNPVAGASCWNSLTGASLTSNSIIP